MASNKERLDGLEAGLGLVQDDLQKATSGMVDKIHSMETTFDEKLRAVENSLQRTIQESTEQMRILVNQLRENGIGTAVGHHRGGGNPRHEQPIHAPHRHVKLELPRFNGGDPTEWISKAKQYFAYQEIPEEQRVSFASYHLTEEANEWWQATAKKLGINPLHTTWEIFEEELRIRFGPTEGENFHAALSKIRQTGTLREYQKEFERLQNKVNNWSEEALVGTFLGGLNEAIASHVQMFAPTTLKDVIRLARLSDDLQRQRRVFQPRVNTSATTFSPRPTTGTPSSTGQSFSRNNATQTPKKLSWEELKRKRSLGLCFSCDERYTPGHKCKKSQLLLMEGEDEGEEEEEFLDTQDTVEPEISLQ